MAGDEAIEQQGFERGAGCSEGAGGFGQVRGGEKAAGGDIEDDDAGVGVKAGSMGHGVGPGVGRSRSGADRQTHRSKRAAKRKLESRGTHESSMRHWGVPE
jgi:hypothetical protein